jgi:hypothetical protein
VRAGDVVPSEGGSVSPAESWSKLISVAQQVDTAVLLTESSKRPPVRVKLCGLFDVLIPQTLPSQWYTHPLQALGDGVRMHAELNG